MIKMNTEESTIQHLLSDVNYLEERFIKIKDIVDYALSHDVDYIYVLEDIEKIISGKEINNDFTHYLN